MSFLAALLSFLVGLAADLAANWQSRTEEPRQGVTLSLDEETNAPRFAELPKVAGPAGRPLVVLDPGHGGRDPGAKSPHAEALEKDLTLAIARAVREEVLASGRVRVALTRDGDSFVPLRDRYEMARQLGAGLFISIHADAAPLNDLARGASVYTLSEVASDREAALLAARENKTGVIGGERLSDNQGINMILIDLAQREAMTRSAEFAQLLRREADALVPFRPDHHRFASLVVLKAPDMPSVLFEAGYLTNSEDSAYIVSPEGQKQIAEGMRRAIEKHFARQLVAARASR